MTSIHDMINPFIINPEGLDDAKLVNKTKPKYSVGEYVDLQTWTETKRNFMVVDIKITYHQRCNEWCYGYLLYKENESTGFTMQYIPEGYLRKRDAAV